MRRLAQVMSMGCDVSSHVARNRASGETSFHVACGQGTEHVVRTIVAGVTARSLALGLAAGAVEGGSATHHDHMDLAVELQSQPWAPHRLFCNVNVAALLGMRDRNGWTPLFYAAYGGNPHIVKLLISLGASVEALDVDGRPAVYYAGAKIRNGAADESAAEHDARYAETMVALMTRADVAYGTAFLRSVAAACATGGGVLAGGAQVLPYLMSEAALKRRVAAVAAVVEDEQKRRIAHASPLDSEACELPSSNVDGVDGVPVSRLQPWCLPTGASATHSPAALLASRGAQAGASGLPAGLWLSAGFLLAGERRVSASQGVGARGGISRMFHVQDLTKAPAPGALDSGDQAPSGLSATAAAIARCSGLSRAFLTALPRLAPGWTPMHLAAVLGDTAAVEACAAMGGGCAASGAGLDLSLPPTARSDGRRGSISWVTASLPTIPLSDTAAAAALAKIETDTQGKGLGTCPKTSVRRAVSAAVTESLQRYHDSHRQETPRARANKHGATVAEAGSGGARGARPVFTEAGGSHATSGDSASGSNGSSSGVSPDDFRSASGSAMQDDSDVHGLGPAHAALGTALPPSSARSSASSSEEDDLCLTTARGSLSSWSPLRPTGVSTAADMDAAGPAGLTPLHLAACLQAPSALARLLALGASPTRGDGGGMSAVHRAARAGALGTLQALLRLVSSRSAPGPAGGSGQSAGEGACSLHPPDLTTGHAHSLSVAQGRPPSATHAMWAAACASDSRQATPLHYAALHGAADVAAYLTSRCDAPCDMRDRDGATPLHLASWAGHDNCITVLLQTGAHPGLADGAGRLPLHYACAGNNLDAALALVTPLPDRRGSSSSASSTLAWVSPWALLVPAYPAPTGAAFDARPVAASAKAAVHPLRSGPAGAGVTPLQEIVASGNEEAALALLAHLSAAASGAETVPLRASTDAPGAQLHLTTPPNGLGRLALPLTISTPTPHAALTPTWNGPASPFVPGQSSQGTRSFYGVGALRQPPSSPVSVTGSAAQSASPTIGHRGSVGLSPVASSPPARAAQAAAVESVQLCDRLSNLLSRLCGSGDPADPASTGGPAAGTTHGGSGGQGSGRAVATLRVAGHTGAASAIGASASHWGLDDESAAAGCVRVLRILRRAGLDLGRTDRPGGVTLAHIAAVHGQSGVLRYLRDSAVSLGECDSRGDSPLHYAAFKGHAHCVGVLLRAYTGAWRNYQRWASASGGTCGVVLDARNSDGATSLHSATNAGSLRVATLLLAAGADVRALTTDKNTLLHLSAYEGHPQLLALFLASGCDRGVNDLNADHRTALHEAAANGHADCCVVLARGAPVVSGAPNQRSELAAAAAATAAAGHHGTAALMSQQRSSASPSSAGHDAGTADPAARAGSIRGSSRLMARMWSRLGIHSRPQTAATGVAGAVEATGALSASCLPLSGPRRRVGSSGGSSLDASASPASPSRTVAGVSSAARVATSASTPDNTAHASEAVHEYEVEYADDVSSDSSDSGSGSASGSADSEGAAMLPAPSPPQTASPQEPAVDRYAGYSFTVTQSARAHLDAGDAGLDTPSHWASCHNNAAALRALVQAGARLETINQDGGLAIHAATINASLECVHVLIACGADLNACFRSSRVTDGGDRESSMHLAASDSRVELLRMLIDAHASINIRNARGSTPLHEACRVHCRKAVELLLRAGADISVMNDSGRTAFGCTVPRSRVYALVPATMSVAGLTATGAKRSVAPGHDGQPVPQIPSFQLSLGLVQPAGGACDASRSYGAAGGTTRRAGEGTTTTGGAPTAYRSFQHFLEARAAMPAAAAAESGVHGGGKFGASSYGGLQAVAVEGPTPAQTGAAAVPSEAAPPVHGAVPPVGLSQLLHIVGGAPERTVAPLPVSWNGGLAVMPPLTQLGRQRAMEGAAHGIASAGIERLAVETVLVHCSSPLSLPLNAALLCSHPAARARAFNLLSHEQQGRLLTTLAANASLMAGHAPMLDVLPPVEPQPDTPPIPPQALLPPGGAASMLPLAAFASLYGSPVYADVTLVTPSGVHVSAHRLVLATRVAALHALFSGGMAETNLSHVRVSMESEVLRPFLRWVYTGRIPHEALVTAACESGLRASLAAADEAEGRTAVAYGVLHEPWCPATLAAPSTTTAPSHSFGALRRSFDGMRGAPDPGVGPCTCGAEDEAASGHGAACMEPAAPVAHTPASIALGVMEAADAYCLPELAHLASSLVVDFLTLEDLPLVFEWALTHWHVGRELAAACVDFFVSAPVARALMSTRTDGRINAHLCDEAADGLASPLASMGRAGGLGSLSRHARRGSDDSGGLRSPTAGLARTASRIHFVARALTTTSSRPGQFSAPVSHGVVAAARGGTALMSPVGRMQAEGSGRRALGGARRGFLSSFSPASPLHGSSVSGSGDESDPFLLEPPAPATPPRLQRTASQSASDIIAGISGMGLRSPSHRLGAAASFYAMTGQQTPSGSASMTGSASDSDVTLTVGRHSIVASRASGVRATPSHRSAASGDSTVGWGATHDRSVRSSSVDGGATDRSGSAAGGIAMGSPATRNAAWPGNDATAAGGGGHTWSDASALSLGAGSSSSGSGSAGGAEGGSPLDPTDAEAHPLSPGESGLALGNGGRRSAPASGRNTSAFSPSGFGAGLGNLGTPVTPLRIDIRADAPAAASPDTISIADRSLHIAVETRQPPAPQPLYHFADEPEEQGCDDDAGAADGSYHYLQPFSGILAFLLAGVDDDGNNDEEGSCGADAKHKAQGRLGKGCADASPSSDDADAVGPAIDWTTKHVELSAGHWVSLRH